MREKSNTLYLLLLTFFALFQTAYTDQLRFFNGDLVQGTLVEYVNPEFKFGTTNFDMIKVHTDSLRSIETKGKFYIQIEKGKKIYGNLEASQSPGTVIIDTGDELLKLRYKNIAWISPEEFPDFTKRKKWSGNIDLGLSSASGNTDNAKIKIEAEVQRAFSPDSKYHDSLSFKSNYEYAQENEVSQTKKGTIEGIYKGKLTSRTSWFFREKASFDEFQDLDLRLEEHVGLAYKLLKFRKFDMSVFCGLARVDSYFSEAEDSGSLRVPMGIEFEWRVWKKLKCRHKTELLSEFKEPDNYLLRAHTNIELPLNNSWGLKFKHEFAKNSRPAHNKNSIDQTSSLSISYTF